MSYSLQQLAQRLGKRRHDMALVTAEAGGDTTHLVATDLLQEMPSDTAHVNAWVYAPLTADVGNRGQERRSTTWDSAAHRLTISAPGFAVPPVSGIYEIRFRDTRERYTEAINSGISRLFLSWYRPIRDESITTVTNTMQYLLPSSVDWGMLGNIQVHLQANPSNQIVGYPYVDAVRWNPRIDRDVDNTGAEVFWLRFGAMPPPDRIVRLIAPVGYSELAADGDELLLEGQFGAAAVEWLLTYASVQLDDWGQDQLIAGDIQKYQAILSSRMQKQLDLLLRTSQGQPNTLITVPGTRDAMRPPVSPNISRLAAFHTPTGP